MYLEFSWLASVPKSTSYYQIWNTYSMQPLKPLQVKLEGDNILSNLFKVYKHCTCSKTAQ